MNCYILAVPLGLGLRPPETPEGPHSTRCRQDVIQRNDGRPELDRICHGSFRDDVLSIPG